MTDLTKDFSLEEVADALGMSPRWIRDRIRLDGIEHLRYGHVIKFTAEQVELLRAAHVTKKVAEPVTTGTKKKAS